MNIIFYYIMIKRKNFNKFTILTKNSSILSISRTFMVEIQIYFNNFKKINTVY